MVKVSQSTKNNIRVQLEKNISVRQIGKALNVPKSTVQDIKTKLGLRSAKKNLGGRPRKLSSRNVTFAVTQLTSGKATTAQSIARSLETDQGVTCSRQTLSHELHAAGLYAGAKKKKPAISEKNRKERLAFAKSHRDWTVADWKTVVFSDETKINRFGSDGRSWSWFREGESLQPRNVLQTSKNQGGNLMIWGCITSKGPGYLADIEGIMDQHLYKRILEGELHDTITWYELDEEEMVFQHDNDPKHTSKSVRSYLAEQEFKTMLWPAQSPDLNPIENAWNHLKSAIYDVRKYAKPASGLKELWRRVETEWEALDADYISNLYESMPRRMLACIKAKGRWTKY
jgi:transposase